MKIFSIVATLFGLMVFDTSVRAEVKIQSLVEECKKQYGAEWHAHSIDGTLSADLFESRCCSLKNSSNMQAYRSKVSFAKKDYIEGSSDCLTKAAQVDAACVKLNADLQRSYNSKLELSKNSRKKSDQIDFEIGGLQQKWVTLQCAKYFSVSKTDSKQRQDVIFGDLPECKRSFFGSNQFCNLMQTSKDGAPSAQFAVCFTEQGDFAGSCSHQSLADKPSKEVQSNEAPNQSSAQENSASKVSH